LIWSDKICSWAYRNGLGTENPVLHCAYPVRLEMETQFIVCSECGQARLALPLYIEIAHILFGGVFAGGVVWWSVCLVEWWSVWLVECLVGGVFGWWSVWLVECLFSGVGRDRQSKMLPRHRLQPINAYHVDPPCGQMRQNLRLSHLTHKYPTPSQVAGK